MVLHAVFHALFEQGVTLEKMLLKPNMVLAGKECDRQAPQTSVATATLRCSRRHVPTAVPGIVFLSGGQHAQVGHCPSELNQPAPGPSPGRSVFLRARA